MNLELLIPDFLEKSYSIPISAHAAAAPCGIRRCADMQVLPRGMHNRDQ